jgi:hypothetical protein
MVASFLAPKSLSIGNRLAASAGTIGRMRAHATRKCTAPDAGRPLAVPRSLSCTANTRATDRVHLTRAALSFPASTRSVELSEIGGNHWRDLFFIEERGVGWGGVGWKGDWLR